MTEAVLITARRALLTFLVSRMLAAGLSLTPSAVRAPLRDPRLVLAALALNFLVASVFAVVLTVLIPVERAYDIGLLLLGGAAGAPFVPTLAESAHADLGFAVALMALLTVGTTLFIPFSRCRWLYPVFRQAGGALRDRLSHSFSRHLRWGCGCKVKSRLL